MREMGDERIAYVAPPCRHVFTVAQSVKMEGILVEFFHSASKFLYEIEERRFPLLLTDFDASIGIGERHELLQDVPPEDVPYVTTQIIRHAREQRPDMPIIVVGQYLRKSRDYQAFCKTYLDTGANQVFDLTKDDPMMILDYIVDTANVGSLEKMALDPRFSH